MDVNALINMLTDGLDPAEAAIVRKSVEREAVKAKAVTLRDASEYESLRVQLEGDGDKTPGAKQYQKWYTDNYDSLKAWAEQQKQQQTQQTTQTTQTTPTGITKEEAQRYAHEAAQAILGQQYAPQWSKLMTIGGKLMQKHIAAGRKSVLDLDELAKTASEKYSGNLEAAYDAWDQPERDKVAKDDMEKEIQRRVKEEIQKKGASTSFPAGADYTPGAFSSRSKEDLDKFSRGKFMNDLANTFVAGTEVTQ